MKVAERHVFCMPCLERAMAKNISRTSRCAGFTLITALAFTLIVGTILAGVGTVALSHLTRSKTEGTYANAVALADAGVNYEIQWISKNPGDISGAHQLSTGGYTPSSPPIPGVNGTFTVGVRDWGTGCNGGDWTNPLQDLCIQATGTFNGVTRTIRVRGKDKSVFDEYAIYALDNGKFNGGGSSGVSSQIIGDMGTNGTLTFTGSSGTGMDTGTVYFNGGSSTLGGGANTGNTVSNPDPVNFPTVTQWANKLFPSGGLTYLASNNSNAQIKVLKSTDPTLASEPSIAGLTLADVNSKLNSAGFTAASRTLGDPGNGVTSDTSSLDKSGSSSSTWRFVQAQTGYITAPYGVADQSANKIYFVPPGDYYFTKLDIKQGSSAIVFLTHLGPIHIWVDTGNTQADSLNGVFFFTDPNPTKFRIFYNKCSQLTIAGNSVFPGGFYAVNPVCDQTKSTQGTPSVKFTGGSEVLGSVIADYIDLGGSTKIVFPNNAGGDPTDFALWFGFKDSWKELRWDDPTNTVDPVFTDGTKN